MWNSRKWSVKPKESLSGHLCWLDTQIECPARTVPEHIAMLEHAAWSFHNTILCHILTHNMQFSPIPPSHSHGISLVPGPLGGGRVGCPTPSHRTLWRCYTSLGLQPGICASPDASARPQVLMQEVWPLWHLLCFPGLKAGNKRRIKAPLQSRLFLTLCVCIISVSWLGPVE